MFEEFISKGILHDDYRMVYSNRGSNYNLDWIQDAILKAQVDFIKKKELEQEYKKIAKKFEIEKVKFNDPATIVFWRDGSKTVVKASGEKFDKEKGLAMAITKKILGFNKGNFNNIFKKWCKEETND